LKIFSEFFGKEIEIPDNPQRIISLAPDVTEMIFMLKVEEKLKGISFYCRRPSEKLQNYERVGSYLKVLWDRIEKIKPDLILTTSGAQRKIAFEILEKGYNTFVITLPQSIYGILDNIKKLSVILNRLEEGYRLIDKLVKKINELKEEKIKKRVYYEVYLGGRITIGSSSYINDGLKLIGLHNIYSFKKQSYFKPDDEETKKLNFDLILYEPHSDKIEKKKIIKELEKRFGKKEIIILPHDFLTHYGPSFIDEILTKVKKLI